jgi:hypothetical protein
MNALNGKIAMAAFALATVGTCAAVSPALAPEVPPEIAAMLKEHLGKWRTEGQWISHGKAQPTKASWQCKAAVDGIGNVCTWNHEWADRAPDSALEIMGYDRDRKTLSITRVTDGGFIHTVAPTVRGNTMTVRWESVEDGKTSVGVNEIVVKAPGDWVQHMTIEVDGERTTEMNVTHHRVK